MQIRKRFQFFHPVLLLGLNIPSIPIGMHICPESVWSREIVGWVLVSLSSTADDSELKYPWIFVSFTLFHGRWFGTEILVYILCLKKIFLNCESNQPALESIHPLVLEDSSLGCCKPVNLLKFGVSFWLKGQFEAKMVGWTNTMSKRWYSIIVDFSKRKQAELLANCYGVMWYFFEIWVMEN